MSRAISRCSASASLAVVHSNSDCGKCQTVQRADDGIDVTVYRIGQNAPADGLREPGPQVLPLLVPGVQQPGLAFRPAKQSGQRRNAGRAKDERSANSVQVPAKAGASSQPSTRKLNNSTGVRLRRRLSRIFHRDSPESGLAALPRSVGTRLPNQEAICQSPRIQRWRRLMSASSREGTPSNSSTSLTRPLRAKQPSIRSWLNTRLSGNRPSRPSRRPPRRRSLCR